MGWILAIVLVICLTLCEIVDRICEYKEKSNAREKKVDKYVKN